MCNNFVGNEFISPTSSSKPEYIPVYDPSNGDLIGQAYNSSGSDVDSAVCLASLAFPQWSQRTIKSRCAILLRFHSLVEKYKGELASLITLENGKNRAEALADVAKGNETVEYACSLPQLAPGRILEVSRGVTCQDFRTPLGVVASVVPFNFPFMVPMWTLPIALAMGNCVVLKPSEKVPLTSNRIAKIAREAGLPPGVLTVLNGGRECVEALVDHPAVRALTFVGSSPVAREVAMRCRGRNKRCTALGGAKNYLVALGDCEPESAARDIVTSFAGCAGQRCMAASVLLLVGEQELLLDMVLEKAKHIPKGLEQGCMGPVIDGVANQRIRDYIRRAEENDVEILLDGRSWSAPKGHWIGPTILLHTDRNDRAFQDEIFGPVLSVLRVNTREEAVAIENASPYGNAACIYTSKGGEAEWFTSRFRAAMLGVNIGIPVPREPFSFGGLHGTMSKYGDADITGDGAIEFFSTRTKISTRWPLAENASSSVLSNNADHANFSGQM